MVITKIYASIDREIVQSSIEYLTLCKGSSTLNATYNHILQMNPVCRERWVFRRIINKHTDIFFVEEEMIEGLSVRTPDSVDQCQVQNYISISATFIYIPTDLEFAKSWKKRSYSFTPQDIVNRVSEYFSSSFHSEPASKIFLMVLQSYPELKENDFRNIIKMNSDIFLMYKRIHLIDYSCNTPELTTEAQTEHKRANSGETQSTLVALEQEYDVDELDPLESDPSAVLYTVQPEPISTCKKNRDRCEPEQSQGNFK